MHKRSAWTWLCFLGGFLAMGWVMTPSTAHAQYKHTSIGIHASVPFTFNVGGDPTSTNNRAKNGYGVGAGGALGLEYTQRFADAWAFAIEAHVSLHACAVPNDICVSTSTPVMVEAFTDLRYYFLTDEFRPFVELAVGFWQTLTFVQGHITAPGLAPGVGFDYFLKEEISIGVKFRYGLQLFIDQKVGLFPFHSLMGSVNVSFFI